jgi:phage terminase small subunit
MVVSTTEYSWNRKPTLSLAMVSPPWLKTVETVKEDIQPAYKAPLHAQSRERILARTEENITPKMKMKRDRFIAEYLFDFNGIAAYIRSGGPSSTAAKMSNQFLKEPYVLKKIKETIDSLEEAEIINRKRILAGLVREAHYQGIGASHGARVSAYSKLATILGMDAAVKIDAKVKFAGGVMVVPMAANVDEWEKVAEASQAQLKGDVRT